MTAKKIKRTIVIETRQRIVIRQGSPPRKKIWCEFCAAQVESLAPEQIAEIFGLTAHEICRRIEDGTLHFTKNDAGFLICGNSLKSNQ